MGTLGRLCLSPGDKGRRHRIKHRLCLQVPAFKKCLKLCAEPPVSRDQPPALALASLPCV